MNDKIKPFLEVKDHLTYKYLPKSISKSKSIIKKNIRDYSKLKNEQIKSPEVVHNSNENSLFFENSSEKQSISYLPSIPTNVSTKKSDSQHLLYRRLPPTKYKNIDKTLTSKFVDKFYDKMQDKKLIKLINDEIRSMLNEENIDLMNLIDPSELNNQNNKSVGNIDKNDTFLTNNKNIYKKQKKTDKIKEKAIKEVKERYINLEKANQLNKQKKQTERLSSLPDEPINSSLNISLNNELARISRSYGKLDDLKKFKEDPSTKPYFEHINQYHSYKALKTLIDKKRQQLLPLTTKDRSIDKLSSSLFNSYKPNTKRVFDIRTVRLLYVKKRKNST